MSIVSEIERINTNIANTYAAAENKGATITGERNSDNLANVVISIPTGGDMSAYFTDTISAGTSSASGLIKALKTIPIIPINGTSTSYMFYKCLGLETIPLLDTSNVTNMSYMFSGCSKLESVPLLNTSKVTTMNSMFIDCINLNSIPLLDTSRVTDFSNVFNNCPKLETIPQLNTSKATNISSLFYNCTGLKSIPLISLGTATSIGGMFYGCTGLETIPLLDTSKITGMSTAFAYSGLKSIPELNTSNVTNMTSTFNSATKLETIPLLDMGKVNNAFNMTYQTTGLINLGGFKDLGKAYTVRTTNNSNYAIKLNNSNNLTHDSLMNVINNLYDLNVSYGGTAVVQQLILGATNIAKLTSDEIAIATNKGWTVS